MNILCTICARSDSKGVPNKNIKPLLGKPLIGYTIEQALNTNLFSEVIVSTDSEEILNQAKTFGAGCWFLRPKELSGDLAPKLPAIQHAVKTAESKYKKKYKVIVDLDASSPLRSIEDIKKSLLHFKKGNYDTLITGCPARRNPYFNMVEIIKGNVQLSKKMDIYPVRRQAAPEVFDMNASIYIWKRNALLDNKTLFTGNTGFYEMDEETSYDIDSMLDWDIVEMIMKKRIK